MFTPQALVDWHIKVRSKHFGADLLLGSLALTVEEMSHPWLASMGIPEDLADGRGSRS